MSKKVDEFNLPVLIIGFNRPEKLVNIIKILEEIQPNKVYFSIDGPRENYHADTKNVLASRALVNKITWDCEVKTNFSEKNYGVGLWPKLSIDWIFSREEFALILEDDVEISTSFYKFCQKLIMQEYFSDEVFAICAWNIVDVSSRYTKYHYFRTKYFSGGGGWATSKEMWSQYSHQIEELGIMRFWKIIRFNDFNILMSLYLIYNFYMIRYSRLKAWDYQVLNLCMNKSLINIIPVLNMSQNTGVGEKATHTNFLPYLEKYEMDVNKLLHPPRDSYDKIYDQKYRKVRVKMIIISVIRKTLKNILGK